MTPAEAAALHDKLAREGVVKPREDTVKPPWTPNAPLAPWERIKPNVRLPQ